MRAPGASDAGVSRAAATTPLAPDLGGAFDALLAGRRVAPTPAAEGAGPATASIDEPRLRAAPPEELESQVKFLNVAGRLAAQACADAAGDELAAAAGATHERGLLLAQYDLGPADFTALVPAFSEATEGFTKPLDARTLNEATLRRVNPIYLLDTLHNNAYSALSAWHGLRGPGTCLSGWSGVGAAAVSLAARAIARGDLRAALACGSGRLDAGAVRAESERLGVARGTDGGRVDAAGRALDAERGGAVYGEGAGALFLEPLGAARERGASPLAWIAGHGASFAPRAADGPLRRALVEAAREALDEAGAGPADLLGLVLHGDGSGAVDAGALAAAVEVLAGARVPVAAWRGATGLCGPGSDVVDLALAATAVERRSLPGTPGLVRLAPEGEGLLASAAPAAGPGRAVLVLSAGPDGQAVALVLAPPA